MPLALQLAVASWRSKSFKTIDVTVTVPQQLQLYQGIMSNIVHELNSALDPLPGPTTLPDSFGTQLEAILKSAYKWNHTVKTDILKYDFEPFIVQPFSNWDPSQMESFERLRSAVRSDRKVISSVSLGLIGSVSLGGARVSRVQQTARVLVDEWFYNSLRGRTATTGSAPQSRPKPPSTPSVRGSTTRQAGMSLNPPPAPNRQQAPEPKKGGFLCC